MTAPKGVKQPTDRQPKADTAEGTQTITAEVRGVEITVGAEILDDFELLDDLSRLDDQDPSRLPSILRRITGDSYRELLETARDKDTKRVTVEAGASLVNEVFEAINPN